jgi:hypothetical protein
VDARAKIARLVPGDPLSDGFGVQWSTFLQSIPSLELEKINLDTTIIDFLIKRIKDRNRITHEVDVFFLASAVCSSSVKDRSQMSRIFEFAYGITPEAVLSDEEFDLS